MSSDISRQRFDPNNDFAAVLMQQGRVLLDADWNEWMEILDRRLRAESTDTVGRCVVPKETPHGFEIGLSGSNLTIGPGRIYVHGLIAENHGGPPTEWDPVLAELRGTAAVPYDKQPYLPDAAAVLPQGGGPHMVYLDVWQREVTPLEDPSLVENAVGVDSTTRRQTAWQVRVLPNVGNTVTCQTPDAKIPGWLDIITPSAGRLTTDTFDAPDQTPPCLIPPTGGYKGLENRLYRVEIHSVDAAGDATFKWARHNASIATAVRQIDGEDLVVDMVGRDADLRFRAGDWVEITDDVRELAGLPGIMRKVKTDPDDATRTITIDDALPAGTFPTDASGNTLPQRHTRIRRWDQQGQVRDTDGNVHFDLNGATSEGVIPVPTGGTALLLEDGIQISFSLVPTGGRFRAGDYWVFASRTADASVEKLDEAPPRGVHHHYCRLALVTFPDTVVDCRRFWPPEFGGDCCDCVVCVSAESHNQGTLTIQQAIDQMGPTGGTVCLGPGTFNVPESFIRIQDAQSVRLHGQGWRTILAHTGPGPTIVIRRANGCTVDRLALVTARSADSTADLLIENSVDIRVEQCTFLQIGSGDLAKAAIGLGGVLMQTHLRDNVIFASTGVVNAAAPDDGVDNAIAARAAPRPLLTFGLYCERNQFLCEDNGVRLQDLCVHVGETVIADNFVSGARQGGLVATGAVLATSIGGSRLDVTGNALHAGGDGIVVGTDDARVHGNDIGPESARRVGSGIRIAPGLLRHPLSRLQITNNRMQHLKRHGIHIDTVIRSAMIKHNQIEDVDGGGIVMDEESSAEHLVIENNQLLQVANLTPSASGKEPLVVGIHVVSARDVDIANNVLRDVGTQAALSRRLVGIQVTACSRARIAGNRIVNLGPAEAALRDVDAIAVIGAYESNDIVNNTVLRQENIPASADSSLWRAVRVGHGDAPFAVGNALLVRTKTAEVLVGTHRLSAQALIPGTAGIRGNHLVGFGAAPAVQVDALGPLLVNDNRVSVRAPIREPVMLIKAPAIIMNANHIDGGRGDHDVARLQTGKRSFTVLGNIASGLIRVNGARLPEALQEPFNIEMA